MKKNQIIILLAVLALVLATVACDSGPSLTDGRPTVVTGECNDITSCTDSHYTEPIKKTPVSLWLCNAFGGYVDNTNTCQW